MEKIKKKNDKYGAKFEDLDENCEKKLLAHYDNDKVEKVYIFNFIKHIGWIFY
jgi:hypothetical protein